MWNFELKCPQCGAVAFATAANRTPAPRDVCRICLRARFKIIDMKVLAARSADAFKETEKA
jgi:hypothetical protein